MYVDNLTRTNTKPEPHNTVLKNESTTSTSSIEMSKILQLW